jgi:hypothetical protein
VQADCQPCQHAHARQVLAVVVCRQQCHEVALSLQEREGERDAQVGAVDSGATGGGRQGQQPVSIQIQVCS